MRAMRSALVLAFAGACGFAPQLSPGDGATLGDDGGTDFVPLHVPEGGRKPGTGALELGTITIDTTALSINGTLPAGVTFDSWPQTGGPELAVLHVSTLTVDAGATVHVVGARPLVVIASGAIEIDGRIDGSADHDVPGPGGALPGVGAGAGGSGMFSPSYRDGGGGGAGNAMPGAAGGDATCFIVACTAAPGGVVGATSGDAAVSVLIGGSGGGASTPSGCASTVGGAGGGALQLSTPATISIALGGVVTAGGGGGAGGMNGNCNWGSGGGGGSGGAIVLQAKTVTNAGVVAANGGGGGGGAGEPAGTGTHGQAGENGLASTFAALGGADLGQWSSAGGNGGALAADAQPGATDQDDDGNGGGGGGSVGRIAIATTMLAGAGTTSPMPNAIPF
jgi:hypothetical protein